MRAQLGFRRSASVEGLESRVHLAAGDLDRSFGPDGSGVALHGLPAAATDYASAVVVQADGKIVVSGTSEPRNWQTAGVAFARYNADGTPDTTFGPNRDGKVVLPLARSWPSPETQGLAILPGGKILVGLRVNYDFALVRFNADGSLDKTFGPDDSGVVRARDTAGFANLLTDLVVRPDGRIVAAGWKYTQGGKDPVFMQFTPDGALDAKFGGGDGIASFTVSPQDDEIHDVALLADGSLLAAGSSRGDFLLLRLKADGGVDRSFGTDGVVKTDFNRRPSDSASSIAVQGDGEIVLAGSSGGNLAFARYSADGKIDSTFGPEGTGALKVDLGSEVDAANDLVLQADGKLVAVGQVGTPSPANNPHGQTTAFAAVRLNANGQVDRAFGAGGKAVVDFTPGGDAAYAAAVQRDGKVVLVGSSAFPDPNFEVARLNANGSIDAAFGGGGTGKRVTPFFGPTYFGTSDAARLADGGVVVSGYYDHPSLGNVAVVSKFKADGSDDAAFGDHGTASVRLPGQAGDPVLVVQADGKIVLIDAVNQGNLMNPRSRLVLARLNGNGSLDKTYGSAGTGIVETNQGLAGGLPSAAIDGRGRLLVAALGADGYAVSRFAPGGALDTTYGSGGSAPLRLTDAALRFEVARVELDAAGRLLLVGTTSDAQYSSTTPPRIVLARLTAGGQYDPTFSPDGGDGDGRLVLPFPTKSQYPFVDALRLQGDRILVGLTQYTGDRTSEFTILRFTNAGAADVSFGDGGQASAKVEAYNRLADLAVLGDGRILALATTGVIDGDSTRTDVALVRFTAGGAIDGSFGTRAVARTDVGGRDDSAARLIVQPDGKALVVGRSGDDVLLARYQGDAPVASRPKAAIVGGVLRITGTEVADTIRLRVSNGQLSIDGLTESFGVGLFSRVEVDARGGNDVVDASAMRVPVAVTGGAGNDSLLGGSAGDALSGGAGHDTLFGGGERDTLRGGDGNDYLNGGPGADQVFGETGNDQIFAWDGGRDTVDGGGGFDRAKGDAGDLLRGVEGVLA